MLTTVVAILGTLAGAMLTALLQQRAQRADRQDGQAAETRKEALDAVVALVAAVSAHRAAMWRREDHRLAGEAAEEDTTATRATRAAVTEPSVRVAILLPALRDQAEAAIRASYALRGATTPDALEAARSASVTADQELVTAAGRLLAAA
ncbi:protein kilB [Kitasatospora sp. HPMI-4]|uniref:protein kilB n=1 Tax=Kitasatospora sp. HPMI-4 TaxID=3448443 RepID=UPI003F1B6B4F